MRSTKEGRRFKLERKTVISIALLGILAAGLLFFGSRVNTGGDRHLADKTAVPTHCITIPVYSFNGEPSPGGIVSCR